MSTATKLMTTEELLAMPDDGVERWLINGELREKPMTVRNRFYTKASAFVTAELVNWCRSGPPPHFVVHAGDAGVRLRREPDVTFGVDVIVVSPELESSQSGSSTIINGIPTLAVEILSPSDEIEEIDEKIESFLSAGVPLVWIMDTKFRTVTVYRPDAEPELFSASQEISGEPHLPGFRVAVSRLFE